MVRRKRLEVVVVALAWMLGGIAAAGESAAAPPTVLEGLVVCSSCWFEADRAKVPYGGPADVACAARCASDGIPQALAVKDQDGWRLLLLEPGGFRPEGASWLPWIGQRVEVRGTLGSTGAKPSFRVDALTARTEPATEQAPGSVEPPDLALHDLDAAPQTLASLRGRVVVLNFWATWCLPCREEMPALARIQNRYAARGVQVVGASADDPRARDAVLAFVEKAQINFPVWLGATVASMERFGLPPMLPGTVVLDRQGRIAARFPGVIQESALAAALDGALGTPRTPAKADSAPVPPAIAQVRPAKGPGKGSLVPS